MSPEITKFEAGSLVISVQFFETFIYAIIKKLIMNQILEDPGLKMSA